MTNQTTYTVQFWHGGEAVWKNIGTLTDIPTFEEAVDFMEAQSKMCDRMVDFRIIKTR